MDRFNRISTFIRYLLKAGAVLAVCCNSTITAQDDPGEFKGPRSCIGCHRRQHQDLQGIDESLQRDFCLLSENLTWETLDLHSSAFEVLRGDLGGRMQRILQDSFGWSTAVDKDDRCLSCHANKRRDREPPPNFEIFAEDGVSCESCHGPSSKWALEHQELSWRKLAPEDKEKLHMVDVRNPLRRAEQCFTCHIGSAVQGKLVTHDMYAAGHPPLPGVELETFASRMPEHWRYLPEKGQFTFKQEFVAQNKQLAVDQYPRTKAVILGSVVALRMSLDLLEAQQQERQPEYALFDCYACHHELKQSSWRRSGYHRHRSPGRPYLPTWSTALIPIALQHAYAEDEEQPRQAADFSAFYGSLQAAISASPFGDARQVVEAIRPLRVWCEELEVKLLAEPCNRAQAARALAACLNWTRQDLPGFQTARQLVMAARTISAELGAPYPAPDGFLPESPNEDRDDLRKRWRHDIEIYLGWQQDVRRPARERASQIFSRLQEQLLLHPFEDGDREEKHFVVETLQDYLRRASDYDPQAFVDELHRIRDVMENE